jgi:hypothetical protein
MRGTTAGHARRGTILAMSAAILAMPSAAILAMPGAILAMPAARPTGMEP